MQQALQDHELDTAELDSVMEDASVFEEAAHPLPARNLQSQQGAEVLTPNILHGLDDLSETIDAIFYPPRARE